MQQVLKNLLVVLIILRMDSGNGQWNTMEIQVEDQSYTVIINGQKVTEFTGSRMTEGYIGLQAHDNKSKVSFRNIMIRELKS